MEFYIADTFTDSIKKLSNQEQKIVKTTAFDLQLNPSHPSLKFHRLDKSKDSNFWSIRVNDDIRIILHKKEDKFLLCYVAHHDNAYQWAEKRKIEIHPKTGAVQIVVSIESVQENLPNIDKPTRKKLFKNTPEDLILACGVPNDWIVKIKESDEDSIFELLNYLPAEAGEALLDLASGKKPSIPTKIETKDPFSHPDSQRRFKLITGQLELEEALLASWSKWAVYLHPLQKSIVEKEYKGPVRISGSAGTGKTIVALHRATHLAKKYTDSRILLSTFSSILANSLHQNFIRLVSSTPTLAERVDVLSLDNLVFRLHKRYVGEFVYYSNDELKDFLLDKLDSLYKGKIYKNLILSEILQVLDAWNLTKWEEYKDFKRLGRRTKLGEAHRREIWEFFELILKELEKSQRKTLSQLYFQTAEKIKSDSHSVYDFVILDEAQDISPSQMMFISSLSKDKANFFFTGDLGQRIFQIPFSWQSFGMDIRGRSFTLKVNYRTSEQIRNQADRLLSSEISDFDGNSEKRKDTISLFQGPSPEIVQFSNESEEIKSNMEWLKLLQSQGFLNHEILLIVRSSDEFYRVENLAKQLNQSIAFIEKEKPSPNKLTACTMHSAKGLEYRAVLILSCDSKVIPKSSRLEQASDESELEEIYATERQLLYVACTRARDILRISGIKPTSEFLEDMI